MLKIIISETPTEERWTLQGRLTAPWVRELRTSWRKKHHAVDGRACIVDLNEITLIDKSGEHCLRILMHDGAEFIASGVYTRHVLDNLAARSKRSLSSFFGGLLSCVLWAVVALSTAHVSAPKAQNETPGPITQTQELRSHFDRTHLGGVNVSPQ
jgi:hypothetical protein